MTFSQKFASRLKRSGDSTKKDAFTSDSSKLFQLTLGRLEPDVLDRLERPLEHVVHHAELRVGDLLDVVELLLAVGQPRDGGQGEEGGQQDGRREQGVQLGGICNGDFLSRERWRKDII